ncbi:hypothetical protein LY76DRAFT_672935 [Colletotrichum caudatum]|nr:hypothetical protein LY76DRAFT_672935 [Colletotrichum caudatum]
MSSGNQETSQNPLSSSGASGLMTPKPSEEPEDNRPKAGQEKSDAPQVNVKREDDGANTGQENEADGAANDADARLGEAAMETKRILACSDTSYAEILAVKPDSSEREKVVAWRRLGCLLHPKSTYHDAAAFKKLRIAAENLIPGAADATALEIEEVEGWDGKEDLPRLDDEKDADGDTKMDGNDSIPAPSALVIEFHNKASPALHRLREDPTDPMALKQVQDLNAEISKVNAASNKSVGPGGVEIPLDGWTIPLGFFPPHYSVVQENYRLLEKDRSNQEARKAIAAEKELIDNMIARDHFPQSWSVLAADEYLQTKDKETATSGIVNPPAKQAAIHYPWLTDKADDGSVIIGARKQGGFGKRVCIEREEDGRIIRRLEAASEVGLSRVDTYWNTEGFKNLADGQSEWTYKDRDDFEELLWVTKSQTKRKNTAAGKKDASADCCVKFTKQGIQILTLSSLRRVLGHGDANNEIEKVCKRDGFRPPWKAGNISEFYDESVVEKDAAKRRALADAQAASPAKNRLSQPKQSLDKDIKQENDKFEQLSLRLAILEGVMKEMKFQTASLEKHMDTLSNMFMVFMEKTK